MLHCTIFIASARQEAYGPDMNVPDTSTTMNPVWMTKYGSRRVKRSPPDIAEALAAAECLTQDLQEKVDLAAELIGLPREDVLAFAIKASKRRTIAAPLNMSARASAPRTVVVEYQSRRRVRAG